MNLAKKVCSRSTVLPCYRSTVLPFHRVTVLPFCSFHIAINTIEYFFKLCSHAMRIFRVFQKLFKALNSNFFVNIRQILEHLIQKYSWRIATFGSFEKIEQKMHKPLIFRMWYWIDDHFQLFIIGFVVFKPKLKF